MTSVTEQAPLRVTRMTWEADGVVALTLTDPAGRGLPAWEFGAHVELRLPSGLARQYSLCGDPRDRTGYTIAVRRAADSRGGSAEIHSTALIGREVAVTGGAVYCCGPNGLVDAVADACSSAGIRCESEHFGAATLVADGVADDVVELDLRRSGVQLVVDPGTTLLEAIREAGVDVESDCEEGYCGTCETGVLDGVPDHRDVVLSTAERAAGDAILPCVSRACGRRLVLDL
jgi:ferredoxin-NADP reductase